MPVVRFQDAAAKANAAVAAKDGVEVLRIGQEFLEIVIADAADAAKKPRANVRLAVRTAHERWKAFAYRVEGGYFKPNAFKDFFLEQFAEAAPGEKAAAETYFN